MVATHQGRSLAARLSGAVLLLGLTLGAASGCQRASVPGVTSSAAKTVASIDQEVLFGLPEFKKAEEQMKAARDQAEQDLKKLIPANGKVTAELQKKVTDMQLALQKKQNELLNPLKERVRAAIEKVSREKKLLVVLDKRIVVYGVPDVTEDVKKVFQESGEIKLGDELDTSKSPIGYFDQDVVRSLKVFQQAEMDIFRKRNELAKEFEKKKANLSAAEQEMLQRELSIKLDAYRESVVAPLMTQVQDSVKEVAQAQGLSLVLDKQHVMTGGRNMTTEVVETFLKKAGGAPGEKGTPTPAGSATPGAQ